MRTCSRVKLSWSTLLPMSNTWFTYARICVQYQSNSSIALHIRRQRCAIIRCMYCAACRGAYLERLQPETTTCPPVPTSIPGHSSPSSFFATAPAATRPMVSRALERPPPATARMPYLKSYVASAWLGRYATSICVAQWKALSTSGVYCSSSSADWVARQRQPHLPPDLAIALRIAMMRQPSRSSCKP